MEQNIHDFSVFEELNIRPLINGAGTRTENGGSLMWPEVLDSMNRVAQYFVDIVELNRKVGEYISSVTDAEAGMVTAGAASGLVLSMAACMAGSDAEKVRRLPNTDGMKNEFIIARGHRDPFTHMFALTGAKRVEIGNETQCTLNEYESAMNSQTSAICFRIMPHDESIGPSLPEVVKVAHAHSIPVIVDAASMLPPKENLKRFIHEGADLVNISGGKMIHGPQNTGLLFGRKDLIEAAVANSSPNVETIGRPYKVSKENMVGLYMALKLYVESNEEQEIEKYKRRLLPTIKLLRNVRGIDITFEPTGVDYNVPMLRITLLQNWRGPRVQEILTALRIGEPPIVLHSIPEQDMLLVNPIGIQDHEAIVIAEQLAQLLTTDDSTGCK